MAGFEINFGYSMNRGFCMPRQMMMNPFMMGGCCTIPQMPFFGGFNAQVPSPVQSMYLNNFYNSTQPQYMNWNQMPPNTQAFGQNDWDNAVEKGRQMGIAASAGIKIRISDQELNCVKSKMEEILKETGLTDAQKADIQNVINKAEVLQKELEALKENKNKEDNQTVLEKTEAVQGELCELKKEAGELCKGISEALTTAAKNGDAPQAAQGNGSADASQEGSAASAANNAAGAKNTVDKEEVEDICNDFKKSVSHWAGTRNELFKQTLATLTPDNIIAVMTEWKDGEYCGDESFIKSFVMDANHRQKGDYGKHILACLNEKAKEKGIDISAERRALKTELSSTVWIDNDIVVEKINAIYDKLNK